MIRHVHRLLVASLFGLPWVLLPAMPLGAIVLWLCGLS